MDTIKKVVVSIVEMPNETKRVVLDASSRQITLLVAAYDTAAVERISNRRAEEMGEEERLICPAKYAAFLHEGRADIGILAQNLVMLEKYRKEAVWFETLRDLPYAVEELRRRFPEKTVPTIVTCVIDWPFDRRKLSPGATLVKDETPV